MDGNHCVNCMLWNETGIPQRGWGECAIARSVAGEPRDEEAKAYACDGEHFSAHLKTRHDFGCSEFKGYISTGPAEPHGLAMCGECFLLNCTIHPKPKPQ